MASEGVPRPPQAPKFLQKVTKKILLQSFDHILASSCMGSLLQRPKFTQTFALFAQALTHMSVKCFYVKMLLRSFDHIVASSCMGSLLQRHKFIQTFVLFAHAVKHMSVKCFYVKNVPNLIPKWTKKGPPEGPQN